MWEAEQTAGSVKPARVVVLSTQGILAPKTGAELRNYHLARQLSAFLKVTYVCFRPAGQVGADSVAGLAREAIEVVSVLRPPGYTFKRLVRGLAGREPISLLNYSSPVMADVLNRVLERERADFVQIESIHMSGYLPLILGHANRPRAVICDWHNIESVLMHRYGQTTSSLPRKLYALQTAAKLRAAEQRLLRQPLAHLAVSELDRAALLEREPRASVFVVENGVDTAGYPDAAGESGRRFRVLFVGAMDYHANAEAAENFVREVWPALHRAAPELVFTVVGREPGPGVRNLASAPNVEVTGTVPDVRPYYREAAAAVVPLRVAGGTRLKILESMAAGVPVVSTRLGVEGLRVRERVHYLPADTPEEFRESILALRTRDGLSDALVAPARELVKQTYDWSVVGASLRSVYEGLAAAAPSPGEEEDLFDGRPKLRR